MEGKKLAVIFQTTLLDKKNLKLYRKLQKGVEGVGDVFFLFDQENGVNRLKGDEEEVKVHSFGISEILKMGFSMMSDRLIPGNVFFAHIHFYEAHPEYDYYWLVEDDVRYSGNWATFFDTFSGYKHDFVSTNLFDYDQHPDWYWWHEFSHPTKRVELNERLRSFDPIYRMSNRAFRYFAEELRTGWRGHYEQLIPTLLRLRPELTMMDMGNDGSFTPPELKNKVYKSFPTNDGSGPGATFYFRPIRYFYGAKKNHIYHPVKRFWPYCIFKLKMLKIWLTGGRR